MSLIQKITLAASVVAVLQATTAVTQLVVTLKGTKK